MWARWDRAGANGMANVQLSRSYFPEACSSRVSTPSLAGSDRESHRLYRRLGEQNNCIEVFFIHGQAESTEAVSTLG